MAEKLVNYGEIRAVANAQYLSFFNNSLGIFFQQLGKKKYVAFLLQWQVEKVV